MVLELERILSCDSECEHFWREWRCVRAGHRSSIYCDAGSVIYIRTFLRSLY